MNRTAAGGGGVGVGVLVVWLAGHVGLSMSAEVGVVIGGMVAGAGAAVAHYGVVGIGRRILFGGPR